MAVKEVTEATAGDYQYYYRPGRTLRPIPPGKDEFSDEWLYLRKLLFEPWFNVERAVTETDATRLFDDHLWQGDELMDPIAELFVVQGAEKRGRSSSKHCSKESRQSPMLPMPW